MKINPTNPYVQIFHNFKCESWQDAIINNNPSCLFHLIETVNNNPPSQEDLERMLRS